MSDNEQTTFDIIRHAVEDNPTSMQDTFAELMLNKIRAVVDERREEIASSFIGGEKKEDEDFEPDLEDEDFDLEDLDDEDLDDIDLEDNEEGFEDGENA